MPEIILKFSEMEWKALEWDIARDIQEHFQNFASEKARQVMEILVEQNSSFNPKKLSKAEKEQIIEGLTLETAKERTIRLEKELEENV